MKDCVGIAAALDIAQLSRAMNWVIPEDSSPGAGSSAGVSRLLELIVSLTPGVQQMYAQQLPSLTEADLADPSNRFACIFIEHVRDVYYAYPDTGSWADIGFRITDP